MPREKTNFAVHRQKGTPNAKPIRYIFLYYYNKESLRRLVGAIPAALC